MNRILLFSFILLVLSCSKYEEDRVIINKSQSFVATYESVASEVVTKTYLDANIKLLWHADDEVSIFTSTLNEKYSFNGKTGDNSGTFSKVITGDFGAGNQINRNYAIYPYDESNRIENDESFLTASLNATQNYALGSVGKGANIAVAVTKNTDDFLLKFLNAGALIRARIYGETKEPIESIVLKGKNNEKVAGNVKMTISDTGAPILSVIEDEKAANTITLFCGADGVEIGTTKETATEFWIVLPPITFTNGLTLTVTDVKGNQMVKDYVSALSYRRNAYKTATIEFIPTHNVTKEKERNALIALYNSLGGGGWTNKANWCSDKPVEEWYGVTVNGEGFVTGVSFENNNLLGTIPAEIGNLTNLKSLRIVGEPGVTGSIPEEICNLESLETLQIENNESLSGNIPENIGDLTNLVTLSVKGCSVSGTMPESIGNLVKLKSLNLSDNNLSGQIPDEFGNMLALEELYLEGNGLWGMIFSHLVKFPNLEVCNLRGNDFIGQIPDEIGSLKNLITLDVGSNHLWGTLPASLVDCVALKELDLSYNSDLSGTLAASLFGRLTKCNIEGTGIELEKGSDLQDPEPGGDINWN